MPCPSPTPSLAHSATAPAAFQQNEVSHASVPDGSRRAMPNFVRRLQHIGNQQPQRSDIPLSGLDDASIADQSTSHGCFTLHQISHQPHRRSRKSIPHHAHPWDRTAQSTCGSLSAAEQNHRKPGMPHLALCVVQKVPVRESRSCSPKHQCALAEISMSSKSVLAQGV